MANRILTGIKPTGQLTLGNYIAVLKNLKSQMDKGELFYFIADLHALTLPIEPEVLRQNSIDLACFYLAAGLDPKKATLFLQSSVSAHSELNSIMQNSPNPFGKVDAGITAIAEDSLHCAKSTGTTFKRLKSPLAISDVGTSHGKGMGQTQGVHSEVTFDARHLLARIRAPFLGRVRALHTLRVENQESGVTCSFGAFANFAHQIFLERFRFDFRILIFCDEIPA